MQKTILITGSTDGIGLETAKKLIQNGHHVILHGRNKAKLDQIMQSLSKLSDQAQVTGYTADLSQLEEVETLAKTIIEYHPKIDVLLNNAGVYKTPQPITEDGLDVRFVVNTVAPYLLTQKLLPVLKEQARVINLSSAAQKPVNIDALLGKVRLSNDFESYAQSKLAITMWTHSLAQTFPQNGPVMIAVNPGSLLATKMVKQGFGVAGHDISIGADILVRLALDNEFKTATGQYFDNDQGQLAPLHPDALNEQKSQQLIEGIESILDSINRNH